MFKFDHTSVLFGILFIFGLLIAMVFLTNSTFFEGFQPSTPAFIRDNKQFKENYTNSDMHDFVYGKKPNRRMNYILKEPLH